MTTEHFLAKQGFKVENEQVYACNGVGLKNLLTAGQQWLEAHQAVVNDLNVFPVPDGDTGTNMLLTLRAALQEVEQTRGHEAGEIAASAAHGALMGARGNSGVILSQFLRGVALGLQNKVTFTSADLAHAVQLGAQQAYQSVIKPVEGTILTVAQALANAAQHGAQHTSDLLVQLSEMVTAAQAAQASTPDLLPLLKEAGVTDSGGQGLVYIVEGWLRFMRQQPLTASDDVRAPKLRSTPRVNGHEFGYDVQYLLTGENLNVSNIRQQIDRMGQSTVVVGDAHTVKVHVHATDPGIPLSYGAKLGLVSDVVVENLSEQARQFMRHHAAVLPTSTAVAVVAVAPGRGLRQIFESLGVSRVITGGQAMNPSSEELLAEIRRTGADKILILPNNRNIMLAAQQAQEIAPVDVGVVPTESIPQGIAAMLAFNPQQNVQANSQRMAAAAQAVITLEITQAARPGVFNGLPFESGQFIGLVNGALAAVGSDEAAVILEILARQMAEPVELLTIYTGRERSVEAGEALAVEIRQRYPDLDVELYVGEQPHYHYIMSLE